MISNAYAIRGVSMKKSCGYPRLLSNQSLTARAGDARPAWARPTVPRALQSTGQCAVRDAMEGHTEDGTSDGRRLRTALVRSLDRSRAFVPAREHSCGGTRANDLYRFRDAAAADGAVCNGFSPASADGCATRRGAATMPRAIYKAPGPRRRCARPLACSAAISGM